ncbi:MAG: hypothetical protein PHY44_05560 [Lachnospiraceae bacterium]|nr:hypothetical protein [Lachnospiraceae bacterium]
MSILWIVWEMFVNFAEAGMFCYLLTKILGYKKDKAIRLYLGFPLLVIFTTILNITVSNTNFVIFILLVANIIFTTVCFESNYSSRFFGDAVNQLLQLFPIQLYFMQHQYLPHMI